MSTEASILVDDRENIRVVLINRPDRRNALTVATMLDLAAAIDAAPATGIRAVVIGGVGEHFSAGGDADAITAVTEQRDPLDTVGFMRAFHRAIESIWRSELPVVAAVAGAAYGGAFNLALACDLIVATADARFCQVFLRRNVVPDLGGSYLLPRLVGLHRAKDLILRPRPVTAEEGVRLGFVAEIADDDVVDRAIEVAREMTTSSSASVALAKEMVNAATDGSLADSLRFEAMTQSLILRTDSVRTAFSAFVSDSDKVGQ